MCKVRVPEKDPRYGWTWVGNVEEKLNRAKRQAQKVRRRLQYPGACCREHVDLFFSPPSPTIRVVRVETARDFQQHRQCHIKIGRTHGFASCPKWQTELLGDSFDTGCDPDAAAVKEAKLQYYARQEK
eukprot:3808153-Amphidinium_carterae.1